MRGGGGPGMGLRPGPRQQAGREVTPLGDPGGEAAKSRARHGSLNAPKCGDGVSAGAGDKCAGCLYKATDGVMWCWWC